MIDLMTNIKAVLTETPERWWSLSRTFSDQQLSIRPTRPEWSARECLQHLVDSEHVYLFRVSCFMKGQDFPNFDPDSKGIQVDDRSFSDLAAEFKALRGQSLEAVDALVSDDLLRRVRHQALGLVSLSQMLNAWAAHDLDHTIQAERALIQPYLLGCGPWIRFYNHHLIQDRPDLMIS